MGTARFYVVSQLGMLAGTAVYVNAGTQLAAIRSPGDILSPGLLGSFVLLGLFPLPAKAGVGWLERRKVYANWTRLCASDGVTIVGEHAGDLLAECVLAMKHGQGLKRILGTIHTYPSLAEANKYAAGAWKRARAPQALLRWTGRYRAWERASNQGR